MKRPYRVAVIGCGRIAGEDHVPAYLCQGDRVSLTACADIRPAAAARLGKQYGIPSYTDPQRMLDECRPDLVSICTPNQYHVPWSIAALRAGAHVFCEKPVALSVRELRAVYGAADAAGRQFLPCQNTRMRRFQIMKPLLEEGLIGRVYYAELKRVRRRGVPNWGSFHMRGENGGGAFCDMGVHDIDLIAYLLHNPAWHSVSGRSWCEVANDSYHDDQFRELYLRENPGFVRRPYRESDVSVEDHSSAFIRYEGGLGVSAQFSWAVNLRREHSIKLAGTKGGLLYSDEQPDVWHLLSEVGGHQADTSIPIPPDPLDFGSGGHRKLIAHALDALDGETAYFVAREEALSVAGILEGFYRSAAEDREVRREEIDGGGTSIFS